MRLWNLCVAVILRCLSNCSSLRFLSAQDVMASVSGLDVQSSHSQQLETDSVPKENGPVHDEAQSTSVVVDNKQPASM